jgi:hypothetical protein
MACRRHSSCRRLLSQLTSTTREPCRDSPRSGHTGGPQVGHIAWPANRLLGHSWVGTARHEANILRMHHTCCSVHGWETPRLANWLRQSTTHLVYPPVGRFTPLLPLSPRPCTVLASPFSPSASSTDKSDMAMLELKKRKLSIELSRCHPPSEGERIVDGCGQVATFWKRHTSAVPPVRCRCRYRRRV